MSEHIVERLRAEIADLAQPRLHDLFEFDADAGLLIWKARPVETFATLSAAATWTTKFANKVAGCIYENGYRRVRFDGRRWPAHRLIWIYANGPIPAGMQIDHINGNRDDNRLANLRMVTHAENGRNQSMRSDNTSGVRGVYWHKRARKWQARIKISGRVKDLGLFNTLKAAAVARAKAEFVFGFHPGHGKVLEKRNAPSL